MLWLKLLLLLLMLRLKLLELLSQLRLQLVRELLLLIHRLLSLYNS